ncbi:MAG: hypothetical protein ACFNT5_07870, partial [Cardiobacterium hominis]
CPMVRFLGSYPRLDARPTAVLAGTSDKDFVVARSWVADVRPAPIRPLLPQLTFITDPQRWGYVFRFGLLSIPEADLIRIMRAMHP